MKIYRFRLDEEISYGVLDGESLHPLRGPLFGDHTVGDRSIPLGRVTVLAPVLPSKIVAVGLNYRDHAAERGNPLPEEPLLFIKPSTAVIGPHEPIIYPAMSKRVDYEGELACVIGRTAARLTGADPVKDYILGYTCFNDVTARDLQDRDKQFTRAKSFDTFAAIGPCIAAGLDPSNLDIKTFLNGKLRQSSNTRNLIFAVPFLVRFISAVMTLLPGDVITTGTPAGIGPMHPGDSVDVQIEGIGTLSNRVLKVSETL
ncbi:MAG: fumarylacetoacetate hydrolase family protein [Candidatus Aminicenantales bacterium]|jgi:2-keto-4-pentenoate hydratase/2-oxohepta-3-ene-1,7-dioic acid hydratase in catechol pathway